MDESGGTAVHRIEFGMEWAPGHVACYLLEGPEPVLFDAGVPGSDAADHLRTGVSEAGYALADIEHLVVTHPHVDHVGQVPTVVEAANPTVYAPAGVRERFAGDADALAERVRANARAGGLSGDQLERAVADAVESLKRDRELLAPDRVDEWVEPGPLEVGPTRVEAIHTPGHQADHLAYLLGADGRRLVSGDTLLEPFRAVMLHDGLDDGHREAFDAFFAGLDRLAAHDPERVYPGHGPVHERFHDLLERDRQSLERRLDEVERLVQAGHETVPAVAAELAGERPARYMLAEAMSALAHLRETGRIDVTTVEGVCRHR
ncbi:MBL fold metallo-hydrolase [Halosegnis sp.]|uniref:MBL fold metallo-hydrolase n=1 Tax=Halosegnis sp. TaxID=2864959 RepID=UPI0035D3E740